MLPNDEARLLGLAEVGMTTTSVLDTVACEAMLPRDERSPVGTTDDGKVRAGALVLSDGVAEEPRPASEEASPEGIALVGITQPGAPLLRDADETKLPSDETSPVGRAETGTVTAPVNSAEPDANADVARLPNEDATPEGRPSDWIAVGIALGGSAAIDEIAVDAMLWKARALESTDAAGAASDAGRDVGILLTDELGRPADAGSEEGRALVGRPAKLD